MSVTLALPCLIDDHFYMILFLGLHEFEKREALAASKELKRLLKGEDNPELSSVADIVYCQKLLAVIERLQKLEAERKMKSVESSSESQEATEDEKQYKLFKDVLEAWNKFKELENRIKGSEEKPRENTDEETENARKVFEKVHSDLISRQDKRISKAEQELESEEENMLNADDRKEAIMKVKEKLEVLMKLKEQKEEFAINKAIKRWNADDEGQVEVRKLGNKLLAQAEEGRADTPEMRGKFVAAYIIELYRQRRKEYLHSQHVLDKFADIYPRAASSNPCQRYVDVGDETYNTIFTDYKKVVKADQPLPVRYSLRALVSKHDQDGGHSSGSPESPHIDHRDEAV